MAHSDSTDKWARQIVDVTLVRDLASQQRIDRVAHPTLERLRQLGFDLFQGRVIGAVIPIVGILLAVVQLDLVARYL